MKGPFVAARPPHLCSGARFTARVARAGCLTSSWARGSTSETAASTNTTTTMSRRDSVGATPPGSNVRLGTRVVVQGRHKGTLAFVGSVHYAKGLFAGVELDDPAGKNNGTVKGHSYFKCKPHHGMLVRPWDVEVSGQWCRERLRRACRPIGGRRVQH